VAIMRDKDLYILNLIVESYLKMGKPISSGSIVQRSNLSISSATVRNIMGRLEQDNYLFQPHTSAGRIPTDKGLRFYVNSLFRETVQGRKSTNIIAETIGSEKGDINSIMTKTSRILSEYSDNIGFVISPKGSCLNFKHLRFIKIEANKVLVILVTTANLVINEILDVESYFTQSELDNASRYLNDNFAGKNLQFVRDFLVREVPRYKLRVEATLRKITDLLGTYLNTEEEIDQMYLQGTSQLLEKPDLFDMKRLRYLFRSFEEKAKLAKLLSDFISLDRVKVLIGSELELPNISGCSLILSHYGDENQILGSLGIIGPKRLEYKKIIPLVEYVAKRLSQTISIN